MESGAVRKAILSRRAPQSSQTGTAYENMSHDDEAKRCHWRTLEAKHGFVEARLTLSATADGGRSEANFTDYRPDGNIGNRTASGAMESNGAPLTLEDAPSMPPGGTGVVRLHPFWRRAWRHVRPGDVIAVREGSRVVGSAVVLRVMWRGEE
jgi:hypothetical protein